MKRTFFYEVTIWLLQVCKMEMVEELHSLQSKESNPAARKNQVYVRVVLNVEPSTKISRKQMNRVQSHSLRRLYQPEKHVQATGQSWPFKTLRTSAETYT